MDTRKWHALVSCALFLFAAGVYSRLSGQPVDLWRVAFWSIIGVASYIALSGLFGFDPHRTRVARYASPLVQYVDRWELRLGQATLSMLGCVALAPTVGRRSSFEGWLHSPALTVVMEAAGCSGAVGYALNSATAETEAS